MLASGKYVLPKSVASTIINLVDRDAGEAITHLKLQKLLYYSQAWYLANFDRPLFKEDFQAWAHGPVCPSIYRRYRDKGWYALGPEPQPRMPDDLVEFIKAVSAEYSKFGAKLLEKKTHEDDPWIKTRGNLDITQRCDKPIDKLLMRNFYAKRLGKKPIKELRS